MEASNRSKNNISRIETKGGRATLESYLEVAKSLEKLQLDRVAELKNGAKIKQKKIKH